MAHSWLFVSAVTRREDPCLAGAGAALASHQYYPAAGPGARNMDALIPGPRFLSHIRPTLAKGGEREFMRGIPGNLHYYQGNWDLTTAPKRYSVFVPVRMFIAGRIAIGAPSPFPAETAETLAGNGDSISGRRGETGLSASEGPADFYERFHDASPTVGPQLPGPPQGPIPA